MSNPRPLTFHDVDGLAFAAARGRLDVSRMQNEYAPASLGPLLEVLHLATCDRLPDPLAGNWIRLSSATPMVEALRSGREGWVCPTDRRLGFIRSDRNGSDGPHRLTQFLMAAQRAAVDVAGLRSPVGGQLAAAIEELESNVHEHSNAPETGVLSFRAAPGVFEFVVSDHGVGVLSSLRACPAYADLPDAGKALEAALTEGVSKHGPGSRHGNGFRPLFIGLVNLNGALRFRSGDHALTMEGTSPSLATARVAQKPLLDGFFASVSCQKD